MNPSVALRTRPRSASPMALNGLPFTRTSPWVGASRPPSTCSSVDLPEPERPMMAMRSARRTSRSIPRSTCTGAGPWYVFLRLRHDTTASLITQRFGRIHLGRAPARVERGEEGKHERDERDPQDVGWMHLRGQVGNEIDVLRHEL